MIWKGGYRGPAITLEEALRWVPPERRAKARVLDVAAGTGCVGSELHREGFRHIDAVDPSEGMMKQRETGIYTNDFLEFIGSGHSTVPKGHIPLSGLDDLVRVGKNGGFVIIVMRHEHLQTVPSYKDKLEPYMDQLEADRKWKKVERRTVPNYFVTRRVSSSSSASLSLSEEEEEGRERREMRRKSYSCAVPRPSLCCSLGFRRGTRD